MPAPLYNLTHSNLRLTSHLFTSNELEFYDIYKHQSYNYQNTIYKPLAYYQEDPINFQINSLAIYKQLTRYNNLQKYNWASNNNLIVAFHRNDFGFCNIILGREVEDMCLRVAQSGYQRKRYFIPFMRLATRMSIYTIDYFRRFFFRLDDLLFLSEHIMNIDKQYKCLATFHHKDNIKDTFYTTFEFNPDTNTYYNYNILYHEYDSKKGLVYRIVQLKDWDWFSFDYIKKNKTDPDKLLSVPMLRICDVNGTDLISKIYYNKQELRHVFIDLQKEDVYTRFKEETKKCLNSISNYTATKVKGRGFQIEIKKDHNEYAIYKQIFTINNEQLKENEMPPFFTLFEYNKMKTLID